MERIVPPRIEPPVKQPGGLVFIARSVRNLLDIVPRAAYEEDFVPFGARRSPRAWVTAPALVKAVLLDERDKFRKLNQIRLLGPLLGKGILTSEGAEWKWQRQAAAPMFRREELASFVPTFVGAAQATVARWRARPGEIHDVEADMTRTTFEVISATLLPSADAQFVGEMQRALRSLQRFGGWDILYANLRMPRWLPRPGMAESVKSMRLLRSIVRGLLERHRAAGNGGDNLMHRLASARDPDTGRGMDDEQLVDNLLTFYLAGHETTAKALTWTLYLLACSKEWTSLLEAEIEEVTGGAAISAAHLERLVRVQQVIKESMRLYPPVPIMSRQAVQDVTLAGRTVTSGTSILIPIYAVHRHAARWKDPDAFDPSRFDAAAEAAIPRYQYMPFGAGPRICIGMTFAMMEATAILATLVRHARFAPVPGHVPLPIARVTLMPRGGMPLKITPGSDPNSPHSGTP
jgi:cytochrome P450